MIAEIRGRLKGVVWLTTLFIRNVRQQVRVKFGELERRGRNASGK